MRTKSEGCAPSAGSVLPDERVCVETSYTGAGTTQGALLSHGFEAEV